MRDRRKPGSWRVAAALAAVLLACTAETAAAGVAWSTVGTLGDEPTAFARTYDGDAAWRHVLLTDRWRNVLHRRQPAAGGTWSARRLLGPGPTTHRAESMDMASTGSSLAVAWVERGGTVSAPSSSYWIAWRHNDAQGADDRWKPVRIIASGQSGSDRLVVSVAISGSRAMLAWGSARGGSGPIGCAETSDGGATWSTGSVGAGAQPAIAIGRLGAVIAYQDAEGRPTVVVRRGRAWSVPLNLAGSETHGIDAAMAGDRAAVTWATEQGVYVRVLRQAGWDAPVRIARPVADPPPEGYVQRSPGFPSIALQGSSRIGVAWSLSRPYVDIDDEIYTVDDVWWRETADGVRWTAPRHAYSGAGNTTQGRSVVVAARWAGSTRREILVGQDQYWARDAPRAVVRVGLGDP